MVKYTFSLKLKDSDNQYRYTLDLKATQEDRPEQIFTSEIRESMRKKLQEQSLCKINDTHLNKMIQTWIKDIQEGYRNSKITLDLPSKIEADIDKINEQGNQDIPTLVNPNLSEIEPHSGMLPPLIFS